MNILDEILEHKRKELEAAKRQVSESEMADRAAACEETPRALRSALVQGPAPAVIAEIKRRSPSRGEIRRDFDPVACARSYEQGGAAALSVLTDSHYFGGELSYLASIRAAVPLPILRKDFVLERYQIDEARVAGADAILLIVSALSPVELETLRTHALGRGLDALVEVHDEAELEIALAAGADFVGVNNRDLRSFDVDLGVTERLASRLPQPEQIVLVAESGIRSADDLRRLERVGALGFLVGESLMREADPGLALQRLRSDA